MSADPFVYLMRRADGRWKIGFSCDPQARSTFLQTEFRQRFTVVRTWQRADAYRVEQIAHRLLRLHLDLATPGRETFKCSRTAALAAIKEAIRIADTPPPAAPDPEPEAIPADEVLAAIRASGAAAWANGVPQVRCPYPTRRERLAWLEGWKAAKIARLIEQMTAKEQPHVSITA